MNTLERLLRATMFLAGCAAGGVAALFGFATSWGGAPLYFQLGMVAGLALATTARIGAVKSLAGQEAPFATTACVVLVFAVLLLAGLNKRAFAPPNSVRPTSATTTVREGP